MTKRVTLIVIGLVIVLGLLSYTVTYTVDYTEHAVVTNIVTKTSKWVSGPDDAGLKFKWFYPVEQVTIYKATLHTLEDAITGLQTRDGKKIIITTYCLWRLENPKKFDEASKEKSMDAAEKALRELLAATKGGVVGKHALADFVNTDPKAMLIPQIEQEILVPVRKHARSEWGIEVVSVGIKTFGLPEGVTKEVIEAMKKEREKEAKVVLGQGNAAAQAIRARANGASRKILAFAELKAQSIESEGSLAAARLYPQFSKNVAFSMFLRWLKSLEEELSGSTVIVLDPSTLQGLKYFSEGASLPTGVPDGGKDQKRK